MVETEAAIIDKYNETYGLNTAKDLRNKKENAKNSNGEFIDLCERSKTMTIVDCARNNIARLEHQRWNTVHLLSGWTKFSKSDVIKKSKLTKSPKHSRQDEMAKQHACITTFEGLTELRKIQADEAMKNGYETQPSAALYSADTICFDFDLMDNMLEN
jgi:hypothetical protein